MENSPIIVESNTALSIVVFEPIDEFLPIKTLPLWLIFCLVFISKPKPVPPILAPDFIIEFSIMIVFEIETFSWIITFLLIIVFGPIHEFEPM